MADEQALLDLNEKLDEYLKVAKADYDAWEPVYDRGMRYILNDQLYNTVVKEGWSRIQVNHIFAAVMQELAVIAQRHPTILGQPREPADTDGTEIWIGVARYLFEVGLRMPAVLQKCALDGKAIGHYAVKVYWEPKAEWDMRERRWRGEPRIAVIKVENLLVDPLAESVGEARFVGIRRLVSVEYANSRWPDFKEEIENAAKTETQLEGPTPGASLYVTRPDALVTLGGAAVSGERDPGVALSQEGLIRSLVAGPSSNIVETYRGQKRPAYVSILEMWFQDEEEENATDTVPADIEAMLADGRVVEQPTLDGTVSGYVLAATGEALTEDVNWPTDTVKYRQPKYPYGRYVLRIGDKAIVNPKPDEQHWYTRHWPVIIGLNHRLPHTWHGLNAVEVQAGMQDWLNVAYMHLVNAVKYSGDPVTIAEADSVAGAATPQDIGKKLKAKAGAVWLMLKGRINSIRREPPPTIGNGIPLLIDKVTEELKNLTGSQDPFRGQPSGGRQTAYEVGTLSQAAAARPQLQSNLLDEFTLEVMEYVIELCMVKMEAGDIVRIVGLDKQQTVAELEPADFDVKFDMRLDVGTAMPFSEEQKKAEALQLYGVLGPVYIERLLQAYNVNNVDEILAAFQQQQQAQAQAAAASATPKVGGTP